MIKNTKATSIKKITLTRFPVLASFYWVVVATDVSEARYIIKDNLYRLPNIYEKKFFFSNLNSLFHCSSIPIFQNNLGG